MAKRKKMSVDGMCWELAEHFLRDEPIAEENRAAMTEALAQHIQEAVENWLNTP